MALPPSSAGATQLTEAEPWAAVATTLVGAPGGVGDEPVLPLELVPVEPPEVVPELLLLDAVEPVEPLVVALLDELDELVELDALVEVDPEVPLEALPEVEPELLLEAVWLD